MRNHLTSPSSMRHVRTAALRLTFVLLAALVLMALPAAAAEAAPGASEGPHIVAIPGLAASAGAVVIADASGLDDGEAQDGEEKQPRFVYAVRVADDGGVNVDVEGPGDGHDERHIERRIHRMAFSTNSGFLGIEPVALTPELRSHFGVADDRGVLVGKVVDDSPAAAAGLSVGDILLAVDGKPVGGGGDVRRALAGHEAGDDVTLEVFRDSAYLELTATLTEAPAGALPGYGGMPHIQGFATGDMDFTFIGPDGITVDLPDMEALELRMQEFSEGHFEEIGEELEQYFSSEEWAETMEQLENLEPQIEIQMEALEERLKELEVQLQQLEDSGE